MLSRCYHGRWRSLHGERRREREWTRSISNRHDRHEKLNMFNFSGGSPRSSRITADEWRMTGDWIRCQHVSPTDPRDVNTIATRRWRKCISPGSEVPYRRRLPSGDAPWLSAYNSVLIRVGAVFTTCWERIYTAFVNGRSAIARTRFMAVWEPPRRLTRRCVNGALDSLFSHGIASLNMAVLTSSQTRVTYQDITSDSSSMPWLVPIEICTWLDWLDSTRTLKWDQMTRLDPKFKWLVTTLEHGDINSTPLFCANRFWHAWV